MSGYDSGTNNSTPMSGPSGRNEPNRNGSRLIAERMLPQDLDAEMALLGCCLVRAESIFEARAILRTGDAFVGPAHRTLWATLLRLADDGKPMDLLIVSDALRAAGTFETVGGADYLVSLAESFADASNAAHYARIVWEKHRRAKMLMAAQRIVGLAYDASADVDATCAVVGGQLAEIAEDGTEAVSLTAAELIEGAYASLDDPSPAGVRVGMARIDDDATPTVPSVGGLAFGSLTLIGARPSVGKSALGMQWAVEAARLGTPSLFLSVEMSEDMVRHRLASYVDGRAWSTIKKNLTEEERQASQWRATEYFRGVGAHFVVRRTRTPELLALARQHVRQKGVRLVVVDYLQLCDSGIRAENRNREVAWMSAAWKTFALEHDVAVVVMSQLNREGAVGEPHLHELRDSGALEQDADLVALLWRDGDDEEPGIQSRLARDVNVRVAKNRNGPRLLFRVEFQPQAYRFDRGDAF